jgi:hypothetical protein
MLSRAVMSWAFVLIGIWMIVATPRGVRADTWRFPGPFLREKRAVAVIALESLAWALLGFGISNTGVVSRQSVVLSLLRTPINTPVRRLRRRSGTGPGEV